MADLAQIYVRASDRGWGGEPCPYLEIECDKCFKGLDVPDGDLGATLIAILNAAAAHECRSWTP